MALTFPWGQEVLADASPEHECQAAMRGHKFHQDKCGALTLVTAVKTGPADIVNNAIHGDRWMDKAIRLTDQVPRSISIHIPAMLWEGETASSSGANGKPRPTTLEYGRSRISQPTPCGRSRRETNSEPSAAHNPPGEDGQKTHPADDSTTSSRARTLQRSATMCNKWSAQVSQRATCRLRAT